MQTADNVAKWFLSNTRNVNNKKLQKLVYYAYAWFLTLNNESTDDISNRLFENHFEAWVHGAVDPSLYNKYKMYGTKTIPPCEDVSSSFSEDEIDVLRQVNEVYGHFSGNELENICHQESPWKNARRGLPANAPSHNPIADADIFDCYAAR